MVHSLNVDRNTKLVQQKKRKINTDKYQIIREEVQKLLKAGLIKGVKYPT